MNRVKTYDELRKLVKIEETFVVERKNPGPNPAGTAVNYPVNDPFPGKHKGAIVEVFHKEALDHNTGEFERWVLEVAIQGNQAGSAMPDEGRKALHWGPNSTPLDVSILVPNNRSGHVRFRGIITVYCADQP